MAIFKPFSKTLMTIASVLSLMIIYYYIPFKFEYMGKEHKIWAHQVNSIEKLNYTKERYSGIELDLVFDETKNTFDVNHPPTASIGLTLESYFSHLNPLKRIGIWMDFKNLTKENKDMALKKLLFLTEKFSLQKADIIIESKYPEFLTDFQKSGFKTSYYLPGNLYKLSEENCLEKIRKIKQNLYLYPTSGISTSLNDYTIITEHFPKYKKYLWSSKKTFATRVFSHFFLARRALNDSSVDILLADIRSSMILIYTQLSGLKITD